MRMRASAVLIMIGAQLIAGSQAALAATCGPDQVSAKGEPSRFSWLAKTKARANWRRKVRAMPGLGPAYATWAQADDTTERCLSGPKTTVCIFTGTPCRK